PASAAVFRANWPLPMMGESASQASYISSQEVGGESGSSPACSNRSLFQYKVIWGSTSSGKAYHCPWYWLTSLEMSLTLSSTALSNRSSSGISVPVRAAVSSRPAWMYRSGALPAAGAAVKSSTICRYQALCGVVSTLPQNSTVVLPSASGASARSPGAPLPHAASPVAVAAAAVEMKVLRFMMVLLVIGELLGARGSG